MRKLVIGFLVFVLSSSVVAFADDAPVPVTQVKNWTGGDLQSVLPMLGYPPTQATIDKLTSYIAAHPDDPEGYVLRCSAKGTVYRNSGSGTIKDALDDCNHALSLAPNTARPHVVAADVLYDWRDYKDSLREYDVAVRLGATPSVYWKRCDAHRFLNELDAALDDCKKAVNLNPNDYRSLYTMGRLLVARKQYDIAIEQLTKALQHKADVNAYYWRGVAYLQNDAQKAEADFSQCILLGDESGDTYRDRGWARIALKNKAGARSDWQHAVDAYKSAGMTSSADIMAALLQKIDAL